VFAGGFCLEALEAIGAGLGVPRQDLIDLLSRLVDKSLVAAEAHGGEMRYRLLEPVRQYAGELLQQAGETDAARQQHAIWCRDVAERARRQLWTSAHAAALAYLDREHENMRAA